MAGKKREWIPLIERDSRATHSGIAKNKPDYENHTVALKHINRHFGHWCDADMVRIL
jgi:hypothetical protein